MWYTTLRGVSETLKQLHFDDTTSAIFVDDEPAPVALTNDTSSDRAEVTHMNSDEEINDYRKNSLRPNIYIYIYIYYIYIYIYIYIYTVMGTDPFFLDLLFRSRSSIYYLMRSFSRSRFSLRYPILSRSRSRS